MRWPQLRQAVNAVHLEVAHAGNVEQAIHVQPTLPDVAAARQSIDIMSRAFCGRAAAVRHSIDARLPDGTHGYQVFLRAPRVLRWAPLRVQSMVHTSAAVCRRRLRAGTAPTGP